MHHIINYLCECRSVCVFVYITFILIKEYFKRLYHYNINQINNNIKYYTNSQALIVINTVMYEQCLEAMHHHDLIRTLCDQ